MKLVELPDAASYSVTKGDSVVSTKLGGGLSRYRRDLLDVSDTVDCSWTCDTRLYNYLSMFYRRNQFLGGEAFTIDLIIESASLATYYAHIVPGSWKVTAITSVSWTVSAQLEIVPTEYNDEAQEVDALYLWAVENWGYNGISILDFAVNDWWPEA